MTRTKLFDQHLHSNHSFDSEADPRKAVLAGIDKNLLGMTFTEHFDTHPDEWDDCIYDDAAYSDTIARLRDEFGSRIFIGKGIEVCYQPDKMDFILDFLSRHEFDLILLSVHWTDGRPIHERRVIEEWGAEDATRRYLRTVAQAARRCRQLKNKHGRRCFDVLGHADFVKRYTARFLSQNCVDGYVDLLDEIAQACVAADLVPEINTSTIRGGLGEPMPGPSFVRCYAAAGGRAMSLGSDAHLADSVGADLEVAAATARQGNITALAFFQGRQPKLIPLTD